MGSGSSRATRALFWSVFKGDDLLTIEQKINEVKETLSESERKDFKLSALRESDKNKMNLFMVSCLGAGEASTMKNRLEFMKKYVSEFDLNEKVPGTNETCLFLASYPRCAFRVPGAPEYNINNEDRVLRSISIVDDHEIENLSADIIEFLLAEGADASMNIATPAYESDPDRIAFTPLQIAARSSFNAAVVELIARGADTSIATKKYGQTALHLAAATGNVKTLNALLATMPKELRNAEDSNRNTALHYAITSSRKEAVECLIANGLDFGTKYDSYANLAKDLAGGAKILFVERTVSSRTRLFGRYFPRSEHHSASFSEPEQFRKKFYTAIGLEEATDNDGNLARVSIAARDNVKPTLNPELAAGGYSLIQACVLANYRIFSILADQGYDLTQPCPLLPNNITPLHIIVGLEGTANEGISKTTFSHFCDSLRRNGIPFSKLNSVFDSEGNRPHVYNMSSDDRLYCRFSSSDPDKTKFFVNVILEQQRKEEIAAKDKIMITAASIDGDANNNDGFGYIAENVGQYITSFSTDYNSDLNDKKLAANLAKFTKIEKLELTYCDACPNAAAILAEHLSQTCTQLNLASNSSWNPATTLENLGKLTQLKSLTLSGNSPPSYLHAHDSNQPGPETYIVNDTTIQHLLNLSQNLKKLDLRGTNKHLTVEGMEKFAIGMKERGMKLDNLYLSRCEGMSKSADMKKIQTLFGSDLVGELSI